MITHTNPFKARHKHVKAIYYCHLISISVIFLILSYIYGIDWLLPNSRETKSIETKSNQTEHISQNKTSEEKARILLTNLSLSLNDTIEKVRLEYGDYFDDLFSPSIVESMFNSSTSFKDKLIRRYQIKILEANFKERIEPFIWSTAGHSAAAGHGNLFNQTLTYMLEDTVKDAFASVGMKFIGNNFAMGGMGSFPELALCMESIYGPDVDILTWDFGMTDAGHDTHNFLKFWGYRAGAIPSNPIVFGIDTTIWHMQSLLQLDLEGVISTGMNSDAVTKMKKDKIPDSTTTDPDSLPPAIKYYMCKGHAETGELCQKYKYDTDKYCKSVNGQVSWHPGWKDHLLTGRLIGFYLLNFLRDAVTALVTPVNGTFVNFSESYLIQLKEAERYDRELFQTYIPNVEFLQNFIQDEELARILIQNQAVCHTALLPSQIRFKHILRPPPIVVEGYESDFFAGQSHLESLSATEDSMTLVFDPDEYKDQKSEECDVLTRIDFKDRFLVGSQQTKVKLPTKKEIDVYYSTQDSTKATIIMCLFRCNWGKCPADYIEVNDIHKYIWINDVKIVNTTIVRSGTDCAILENTDNQAYWDYDSENRLNFEFRDIPNEKHIFISSIVMVFS